MNKRKPVKSSTIPQLNDVTGFRGEKIVELCLTNYKDFKEPLFHPGFLGDKWPTIDFYVELTNVNKWRPYFFGQTKSTRASLSPRAKTLKVRMDYEDIIRLKKIPGPTYIFGVHEPSMRVYIRAIHRRTPNKTVTTIPLSNELTSKNLQILYREVKNHWNNTNSKPNKSVFS